MSLPLFRSTAYPSLCINIHNENLRAAGRTGSRTNTRIPVGGGRGRDSGIIRVSSRRNWYEGELAQVPWVWCLPERDGIGAQACLSHGDRSKLPQCAGTGYLVS